MPLDAIVLGGRRASTVPLVTEATDWIDGVFAGATMGSERTAAADGAVGELRFDPFAMLPFAGYGLADHWDDWLRTGARLGAGAPRVFRVNWFRKDAGGRFVWPGFGENIRVLDWIVKRLEHEVPAVPAPVGLLPYRHDLELGGLDLTDEAVRTLLSVDVPAWRRECDRIAALFDGFGERLPLALRRRLDRMRRALATYP